MRYFLTLIFFIHLSGFSQSQNFEITELIPHSSIKDQGNSGTCWCYATTSFIESELMRIKGLEIDLSEMFTVRYIYPEKVITYSRMQGNSFLSQGGQAQNVMASFEEHGICPEDIFPGKPNNNIPDHSMLEYVISFLMNDLNRNYKSGIKFSMIEEIDSVLNIYIGQPPAEFNYKYQNVTPLKFRKDILGIHTEDYIELTSFNHQPYYTGFVLKDKYNWASDIYYNIPLEQLTEVIDHALETGFSVCWNGDVSEPGFNFFFGTADILDSLSTDQEVRQQLYDSQSTTVDHLMHIVGKAKNTEGEEFYYVKNSWGKGNVFNGYMYMSRKYLALKTVSVFVHKDAVPKHILDKISFCY